MLFTQYLAKCAPTWAEYFCRDEEEKNSLNSTGAKLAPQKLAQNLLLLSSNEADLFGRTPSGSLNSGGLMSSLPVLGADNNVDERGIFAHIH